MSGSYTKCVEYNGTYYQSYDVPGGYSAIYGVLYLSMIMIATVFNSLIIWCLVKFHAIRSNTNILIGSTAVVNILRCLVYASLGFLNSVSHTFPMGKFMCEQQYYFRCFVYYAATILLMALVLSRLASLTDRIHFFETIDVRKQLAFVAVLTLVSLALSKYFLFNTRLFNYHRYDMWRQMNFHNTICIDISDIDPFLRSQFVTSILIHFFLTKHVPILLIVFLYIRVWILVRHYMRRESLTSSLSTSGNETGTRQSVSDGALILYSILAIITRIPDHIWLYDLLSTTGDSTPCSRWENSLSKTNIRLITYCFECCIDPLIFGLANKSFKRSLDKILSRE